MSAELCKADFPAFFPVDAWAEGGVVRLSVDAMGEDFTMTPERARRVSSEFRLMAMEAERQQSEQDERGGS